MANIAFLDSYTIDKKDISWESLKSCGKLTLYDRFYADQHDAPFSDTDVLIVNKVPVNEKLISLFPNTKLVVVSATGYNNVDIPLCASKNITVCNVRGYSTEGVVQHVFAAIFSRFNRLEYYTAEVKKGRWQQTPDFCFYDHSIAELAGKTLGVIGYGTIGKRVSQVAEVFGMDVLVFNKYGSGQMLSSKIREVELEEVFSVSDVISLHVPLNPQTKELINKHTLAYMKENVTLVNTGRGALINEADLASWLNSHPEAVALLDVVSEEPPVKDNPLFTVANCFITPHIAWASLESRTRLLDGVAENIRAFQNNAPINTIF
jgi:glycerate dehydrogenase